MEIDRKPFYLYQFSGQKGPFNLSVTYDVAGERKCSESLEGSMLILFCLGKQLVKT